ncbi:MAG: hypothetical protein LBB45_03195 [Methanobrevibacter sp.]|jgi:hypothetical protein|nr:hypothetical protein [Candidatus Methanovirga basalitermitum]
MGSVPRDLYSVASATVSTMRVISQTLSIEMLIVVFAFIIAKPMGHFPQLLQSSNLALTISTVLCFISMIASLIGIELL